jgi:uncharacterized alpha-E superfamily protein
MLSRVADALYWIGRYSERTYTNAHILNYQLEHMLELGRTDKQYKHQWNTVLSICGYYDDFSARYGGCDISQMLYYLCKDEHNLNALDSLINKLRNNAKNSRDCIPNELFEEWNSLYLLNKETSLDKPFDVLEANEYLANIRKYSLTSTGIIDSVMTRDDCYHFIKIGKWLERSEKTALILLNLMEDELNLKKDFPITTALQFTNTFAEYIRRSGTRETNAVLNFLINEVHCSKSILYGITKIKSTIIELENYEIRPYAQKLIEAITDVEKLLKSDVSKMTVSERKQWIIAIHNACIHLGPIFSKTYYLTEPILVK